MYMHMRFYTGNGVLDGDMCRPRVLVRGHRFGRMSGSCTVLLSHQPFSKPQAIVSCVHPS